MTSNLIHKRLMAFSVLCILCARVVDANIIAEKHDENGFSIVGDKYVAEATACSAEGIAKDYFHLGFISGLFPEDRRATISNVTWNSERSEIVFKEKNKIHIMSCIKNKRNGAESLSCSFQKNPLGINSLSFTIERKVEENLCREVTRAQGQIGRIAAVKYKRSELHKKLAQGLLSPYRFFDPRISAHYAGHTALVQSN